MAKFLVMRYFTTYVSAEVESDNVEDAVEEAKRMFADMDDETYCKTILENVDYDYDTAEDEDGNIIY